MEPASSRRLMDSDCLQSPGPESSAAVIRMMLTPMQVSPAAMARSMGAAPLYAGSSEPWTLMHRMRVQQSAAEDLPEGGDDEDLDAGGAECSRTSGALMSAGWMSSRPRRRAATAAGGAAACLPRPTGPVRLGDDQAGTAAQVPTRCSSVQAAKVGRACESELHAA